jgi:hypothetical protein
MQPRRNQNAGKTRPKCSKKNRRFLCNIWEHQNIFDDSKFQIVQGKPTFKTATRIAMKTDIRLKNAATDGRNTARAFS